MKANYTKPMLTVELLSLTQSTTRDCSTSIPKEQFNFSDPAKCGWDLGGGTTVFVLGGNVCTMDGENMGVGCYNNPGEGNYIFRS